MNSQLTQEFDLCVLCSSAEVRCLHEGIRDFEYQTFGEYSWVQCLGCMCVRIAPYPTNEILKKAYPPHYHAFQKPSSVLTTLLINKSRQRLAESLVVKLPSGGSILDNGCSTGDLLEAIGQKGDFKLYGIEYMSEAADIARGKGIQVWQGSIEEADIPVSSMDLITMQHVLEHVFNPMTTLKKCQRILKPGGRIIGELPNFDSWDASFFGKYWGGGHAPRHIWHFTPNTLKEILKKSGFYDIKITSALHTGHWALSVQNYLRKNRGDATGLKNGRVWYYPLLLLLFVPLNLIQMPLLKTGIMRFEAVKI